MSKVKGLFKQNISRLCKGLAFGGLSLALTNLATLGYRCKDELSYHINENQIIFSPKLFNNPKSGSPLSDN